MTTVGSPGSYVKIELFKGGVLNKTLATASIGGVGVGSYAWTIPAAQAPGADYKIKVTSTTVSTCTDMSDANFSIGSLSLASSAGPDQKVLEGSVVTLSGANSVARNGIIASYRWTQSEGAPVALSADSGVELSFVAPDTESEGQSLAFELKIVGEDGAVSTNSCIVNVTRDNTPPTADAGANVEVVAADVLALDGSGSSDADQDLLTFAWSQIAGIPVELCDAAVSQPVFIAPEVDEDGATLVFELTVTDQGGLRSRDTCIVNVSG